MNRTVVVYGPQGCGKTQNAERLRTCFGLDYVIDNWEGGELVPLHGALVLTSLTESDLAEVVSASVRRADFGSAMRAARGAAGNDRRERIATAVLAGLASIPFDNSIPYNEMPSDDARRAIAYADALIAELDK